LNRHGAKGNLKDKLEKKLHDILIGAKKRIENKKIAEGE